MQIDVGGRQTIINAERERERERAETDDNKTLIEN